MALSIIDQDVRGSVTRLIAALGYAPTHAQVAASLGITVAEVEAALDRLHATHSLLLHPHQRRVWVAHPFALSAGSCWVQTAGHGYWANCLYCALGIAAATERDAVITTRLGGEGDTVHLAVKSGQIIAGGELLFHLSTPAAHWWDNVIAACASFQPFRNEAEVIDWCARHAMPRGHVMTIPQLWAFASDWYGSYINQPWRKRSREEIRTLFARHALPEPFWRV